MQDNPWQRTDLAIDELNKIVLMRFSRAKRKIAKAEDYQVVVILTALYKAIDKDFRRITEELAEEEYEQYIEDDDAALEDLFLERILKTPDDVTKYSYETELTRKRDRAIEAVVASHGVTERNRELDKALRFFSQMAGQYQDEAARSAAIQALKDNGVKYVVWRTEKDSRVCMDCLALDGKIFPIKKIPRPLHWRCRCRVEKMGG